MDSTSIFGLAQQLVQHGLKTSPSTGNGYGLALGTITFIALALAYVLWRKDRAWTAERTKLTSEFIAYLKRINSAKPKSGD
jgi:hypothetical protein